MEANANSSGQQLKILFVDDEPFLLEAFQRQLDGFFSFDTATSGEKALAKLELDNGIAVVISDMKMPGLNGVDFLSQVRTRYPEVVRVMLTGCREQSVAMQAVNNGAVFRFLTKPCSIEDISNTINDALSAYKMGRMEKELLQGTLAGTIKVLTDILSLVDPSGFGRAVKVRATLRQVLNEIVVAQGWEIELAAMLGPLGEISLTPDLRRKLEAGAELSDEESDLVARTPQVTKRLLTAIPRIDGVISIIEYLKKDYSGKGYPKDAIAGESIPFGARLLRIVNDIEDLSARGMAFHAIFTKLLGRKGRYDTRLLNQVLTILRKHRSEDEGKSQTEFLELGVNEIKPGDVLKHDVRSSDDQILVPSGAMITEALMERLRNFATFVSLKEPLHIERRKQ